ncbi:MAG: helix-turn-helix domain-containing protein [Acidobacteria bacterium]|nr:helix-turn-helix domain-containing protein [Acidobacteriota bacterium]
MDWRSSERLKSRRPIADDEVQLLEELGRAIGQARGCAGRSRRALAESALMHPTSIARIEYGTRRTRSSTLKRIARALAAECDDLDPDALVESWLLLGGRAIAPESDYSDRIELRRQNRVSRKRSRESKAQELVAYRNRRERAELNRQRSRSLLEVTLAYDAFGPLLRRDRCDHRLRSRRWQMPI